MAAVGPLCLGSSYLEGLFLYLCDRHAHLLLCDYTPIYGVPVFTLSRLAAHYLHKYAADSEQGKQEGGTVPSPFAFCVYYEQQV